MLTKIPCNKITDTQPRRDHGNIDELKQSIQEVGLLNPLTINQNYKLLAGRRRFQAITELGWEEVEVNIINTSFDSDHTFELDIEQIKNRCEICQYPFADIHHILPKKYGGTDDESNKICLCSNHHRAVHFLLQLELLIAKNEEKLPPQTLDIQKFLYMNDEKIVQFYQKYLRERIKNEANKTRPSGT